MKRIIVSLIICLSILVPALAKTKKAVQTDFQPELQNRMEPPEGFNPDNFEPGQRPPEPPEGTPPEGFEPNGFEPGKMPPDGIPPEGFNPGNFKPGQMPQELESSKETPSYEYQETTGQNPQDLYSNFTASAKIQINFSGKDATIIAGGKSFVTENQTVQIGKDVTGLSKEITISRQDGINEAQGITIEFKGDEKLEYILSGSFEGTFILKNKNADCSLVLNNVKITSSQNGPAIRTTSDYTRTFFVVPEGTVNTIADSRTLETDLLDDKKGSIYAKGTLIFTGTKADEEKYGSLKVINNGYKHAVYSKDYIRIANLNLEVSCAGRDCIRSLNGVIIDSGKISLTGTGTIYDDESVGIKVEGEDADEDEKTVTYSKGCGFIIINGGNLTIDTIGKGITAHWKVDETFITNQEYTQKDCNKSLLLDAPFMKNAVDLSEPNPFVTINGGNITITTKGQPTDDLSPEGIEAKNNLLINNGKITITSTDDALNAGGGIKIAGGQINVVSSLNDAIDANGTKGIEISGGIVVAVANQMPECAFDCDNNVFKITGGIVLGLGTSNYSNPTKNECTQNVIVASSSKIPSNQTFAVIDSHKNPVFAYTFPQTVSRTYEVMIFSSPLLQTSTEKYTIVQNVKTVQGEQFDSTGLFTNIKSLKGGTNSTDFTIDSSVTTLGQTNNFGPREGPRHF